MFVREREDGQDVVEQQAQTAQESLRCCGRGAVHEVALFGLPERS